MKEEKITISKVTIGALTALVLSSCEKGGSVFSVLSSSAQYQQHSTYVPRELDVLFVVDNSGSMSSSQQSLATKFPSFINYFKAKGYDFKIAVTTSDAFYGDQFISNGCIICNVEQTRFRSGASPAIYVIDNNTPNLESVFAQNVNVGIGGSGDERAFASIKAALSSSLNIGFHRPGAYLAVVIVSDEDDFSQDNFTMNESYTQPTIHPVSRYVDFLAGVTSGTVTTDFSVSTISVLDSTCRSSLGAGRKIGQRYMEIASATHGSQNSICDNFDSALNNISSNIAVQTVPQFLLNRVPILSSIRVIVDGTLVAQDDANGWSYDSTSNSIFLKGTAAPSSGATVIINFDPTSVN